MAKNCKKEKSSVLAELYSVSRQMTTPFLSM